MRRTEPTEDDIKDGITFDKQGRMDYHPEFHTTHGDPITPEEKIYIAKYYDVDDARTLGFALGKTEKSVMSYASKMRKSGEWDYYRSLTDEEWERLLVNRMEEEHEPCTSN